MDNKNKISELLTLFKKGELSPAGLQQLYDHLQHNSPEILEVLNTEWEKTSSGTYGFNPQEQFNLLKEKLGIGLTRDDKSETQISLRIKKTIYKWFGYAAALIIGFGITWLVNQIKHDRLMKSPVANRYSTINVAYGSKSTIQLPDGSVVNLNSGSKIKYASLFGTANRTVFLEGEGFFTVKKDPEHPFFVQTRQIIIKAVGTSFNIKSYLDEDLTETTLVTGTVEIYQNDQNHLPDKQSVRLAILHPNQKAIISDDEILISDEKKNHKIQKVVKPEIPKVTIEKKISTELFTDWRKNILIFDNEKFTDIIKRLERWYNVEVTLEYKALANVRFSGKFDRETIQDVLNGLKMIQSFNYEMHKNKIIIYSN